MSRHLYPDIESFRFCLGSGLASIELNVLIFAKAVSLPFLKTNGDRDIRGRLYGIEFRESYPRPLGKCCASPGIVIQRCIVCSQTDRTGGWNSGSAIVPTATPIIVGCLPARA